MPRKDAGGGPISAQAQQDLVSEGIENFELPKTIVTKIAKSALPDNVKLQKETVLSLVKGSTVFINYLAATAHDVALSKQHKSISASDVLKALEMIEFGDLVDPLQNELQGNRRILASISTLGAVYRDNAKGDKNRKAQVGVERISNPATNKGKAKEGESISSASRSKGKEKEALPPPFTTLPHPGIPSSVAYVTEDVEMGVHAGEHNMDEVGEGESGGDYAPELGEDVEEPLPPGYETEEEVDVEFDESEELRKDAVGLDEYRQGEEPEM